MNCKIVYSVSYTPKEDDYANNLKQKKSRKRPRPKLDDNVVSNKQVYSQEKYSCIC